MATTKLTKPLIRRWIRQGKSIKAGDTWYTIERASKRAEKIAMSTAAWELERGKKPTNKFVTWEDLLKNVNNGSWMVKINDKPVGATVKEDVSLTERVIGDLGWL